MGTGDVAHIGVDIGGTKVAAGVVAAEAPTSVYSVEPRPTNAVLGGEVIMDVVFAQIDATLALARERGFSVRGIGIGAPGVIDSSTGEVVWSAPHMPGWQGMPIGELVAARFNLPVVVDNDVRVMALGEVNYGVGYDADCIDVADSSSATAFLLSLGTGVNGCFITDGDVANAGSGVRSEYGFALCPDVSGRTSFLNNVGSGLAIEDTVARALDPDMLYSFGIDPKSILAFGEIDPTDHAGAWGRAQVPSLRELMPLMRQGLFGEAYRLFQRSLECVGVGLAGIINMVGADRIILGGGIGTLPESYEPLVLGYQQAAMPEFSSVPISVASLGSAAPVIGAAHLARIRAR